jgi:hypothetical protein
MINPRTVAYGLEPGVAISRLPPPAPARRNADPGGATRAREIVVLPGPSADGSCWSAAGQR